MSAKKKKVKESKIEENGPVEDGTKTAAVDEASKLDQEPATSTMADVSEESLESWRDRALRAQAEMANMRRRLENDTEDRTRRRMEALFHELILVADHMELALAALPDSLREAEGADNFLFGLDAIRSALDGVMRSQGLEFIEPGAEDEFDPELHEAVQTEHRQDLEGARMELLRRGYRIGRLILRPAQVRLLKAAASEPPED